MGKLLKIIQKNGLLENVTIDDFKDFENHDFTLKKDCEAVKDGFPIIDMSEIGLLPNDDKGLSPGAIAGIVIGCLAFVAIVVSGIVLVKKRRGNFQFIEQRS